MNRYSIYKILPSALFIVITLSFTCSGKPFRTSIDNNKVSHIHKPAISEQDTVEKNSREENLRLSSDITKLKKLSNELESLKSEMLEMRANSKVWTMEYFPPEEHDRIENILFRYLMIRNALWEIIDCYKDYREHFTTPETQTKGFIIGYSAGLHLTSYTSMLVATFINEPAGKRKLNEAYPRSEIKADTYEMLLSSLTSIDHMEAIKVAWVLFNNEKADTSSVLYTIYSTDLEYQAVIDRIGDLYNQTDERITYILKKKSLLFPKTVNRLRHSVILTLAETMKDKVGDNLYAIRGLLFSNVSDIKMPLTRPIQFTDEQKKELHSILRPGDIILTYTAGYMSNIFLPGSFKHGITYVGDRSARKIPGLASDPKALLAGININKLEEDFNTDLLESGLKADVIEAVAEGVIFNSLDLLLDTHINRMVVLRPRLSMEESKEAITILFALLGSDYDFKFDFNDGSYLCCTEVIYRALNSRGDFNFGLVKRMGTPTLSADDILEYYVRNEYRPFDIIVYAEKDRSSDGHMASLYKGDKGLKQLKRLMNIQ
ncbi:MAG: hypothetical protein JW927_04035 [Deltaproteobacteria bacterium]|nr:hypothetical protein [Deltaproteobacteria bacterium]